VRCFAPFPFPIPFSRRRRRNMKPTSAIPPFLPDSESASLPSIHSTRPTVITRSRSHGRRLGSRRRLALVRSCPSPLHYIAPILLSLHRLVIWPYCTYCTYFPSLSDFVDVTLIPSQRPLSRPHASHLPTTPVPPPLSFCIAFPLSPSWPRS
jgi:hypothetical protein